MGPYQSSNEGVYLIVKKCKTYLPVNGQNAFGKVEDSFIVLAKNSLLPDTELVYSRLITWQG